MVYKLKSIQMLVSVYKIFMDFVYPQVHKFMDFVYKSMVYVHRLLWSYLWVYHIFYGVVYKPFMELSIPMSIFLWTENPNSINLWSPDSHERLWSPTTRRRKREKEERISCVCQGDCAH